MDNAIPSSICASLSVRSVCAHVRALAFIILLRPMTGSTPTVWGPTTLYSPKSWAPHQFQFNLAQAPPLICLLLPPFSHKVIKYGYVCKNCVRNFCSLVLLELGIRYCRRSTLLEVCIILANQMRHLPPSGRAWAWLQVLSATTWCQQQATNGIKLHTATSARVWVTVNEVPLETLACCQMTLWSKSSCTSVSLLQHCCRLV